MAGRVKKQVVFILPKGFLSNKLRDWWLTYTAEIAPDRKADSGRCAFRFQGALAELPAGHLRN